jgi:hypothetical protein
MSACLGESGRLTVGPRRRRRPVVPAGTLPARTGRGCVGTLVSSTPPPFLLSTPPPAPLRVCGMVALWSPLLSLPPLTNTCMSACLGGSSGSPAGSTCRVDSIVPARLLPARVGNEWWVSFTPPPSLPYVSACVLSRPPRALSPRHTHPRLCACVAAWLSSPSPPLPLSHTRWRAWVGTDGAPCGVHVSHVDSSQLPGGRAAFTRSSELTARDRVTCLAAWGWEVCTEAIKPSLSLLLYLHRKGWGGGGRDTFESLALLKGWGSVR